MKQSILPAASLVALAMLSGCNRETAQDGETMTVTDQRGRTDTVPKHMTRISALHHFGGRIVFALGQQDKLIEQSLYGREAKALAAMDPKFAAMPKTQAQDGQAINIESLIALGPQCAFVYACFDKPEMPQLEFGSWAVFTRLHGPKWRPLCR